MNNELRPAGITADRNKQIVQIEWGDGHQSRYPFAGLRAVCPCVMCKGGHANMGGPPDPKVVRDTPVDAGLTIDAIAPAGNYAINIIWNDGHDSGIFSWKMLRQACPCPVCTGP